jgi:hypothetical protein
VHLCCREVGERGRGRQQLLPGTEVGEQLGTRTRFSKWQPAVQTVADRSPSLAAAMADDDVRSVRVVLFHVAEDPPDGVADASSDRRPVDMAASSA